MFVPILTDEFNYWFPHGTILGSVTKGVITLLKKGGGHVLERLDDYKSITLLNTVKDFGPGLSEPFAACSNLIGPEQNYAVKGRSKTTCIWCARS